MWLIRAVGIELIRLHFVSLKQLLSRRTKGSLPRCLGKLPHQIFSAQFWEQTNVVAPDTVDERGRYEEAQRKCKASATEEVIGGFMLS